MADDEFDRVSEILFDR
ncbi:unnamed protein product, partial [Rotaria magnacalcarata]